MNRASGESDLSASLDLREYLDAERISFLNAGTKDAALAELAEVLARAGAGDAGALAHAIARRESQMSTSVGCGIGIPHASVDSVPRLMMAVGIHAAGIGDYQSLDGCPVKLVVLIAAAGRQQNLYLRVMSQLARTLRDEGVRDRLLACRTRTEVFATLAQAWEAAGR